MGAYFLVGTGIGFHEIKKVQFRKSYELNCTSHTISDSLFSDMLKKISRCHKMSSERFCVSTWSPNCAEASTGNRKVQGMHYPVFNMIDEFDDLLLGYCYDSKHSSKKLQSPIQNDTYTQVQVSVLRHGLPGLWIFVWTLAVGIIWGPGLPNQTTSMSAFRPWLTVALNLILPPLEQIVCFWDSFIALTSFNLNYLLLFNKMLQAYTCRQWSRMISFKFSPNIMIVSTREAVQRTKFRTRGPQFECA